MNPLPKLLVSVLMILLLFIPVNVSAYLPKTDDGFIQAILDDNIVVEGFLGTHILELVGVCSWCEVGSSVAVRFISATRAELIATESTIKRRPVLTIIIRDGREQEP